MILRVLIADDEPIERRVLQKLVLDSPAAAIVVGAAKSGNEMLEMAKLHQPDLILMDIRMPGMSGLEAAALIKVHLPDTMLCVITAYDEFNYAKQAIDLHVDYFLLKPVEPAEINRVIQESSLKQGNFGLRSNPEISPLRRKLAEAVVDYLHAHYDQPLRLERIGEQLNVSPQYLSRIFKAVYNTTIMNYLTLYRINQALPLLKNSDMSIARIAEHVGFSDSSHFGQVFKKRKGMTPFHFRCRS